MNDRGIKLLNTANWQIADLIELLSTADQAALRLPCPGREQLGDGTVAACALHTAHTYRRIAGFLRGHADDNRHDAADHDRAQNVDPRDLLARLAKAQDTLTILAHLTDEQLDAVPPAGTARFCDGHRTFEQVVTGMLKHQGRQIDALKAALA